MEFGSVHLEFPIGGMASVRERASCASDRGRQLARLLLQPRAVGGRGGLAGPRRDRQHDLPRDPPGEFRGHRLSSRQPAVAGAVHGVRAWASVRELPEAPDLVVIAVPSAGVIEVAWGGAAERRAGPPRRDLGVRRDRPRTALGSEEQLVELVRSHGRA